MSKDNKQPWNQEFFNNIAAEFDTHVKQSIPMFSLFQQHVVKNISQHFQGASILDIAGSTGELGRQLIFGGWEGDYVCLDGSPKMRDVFESVTPEGAKKFLNFELGAFGDGWDEDYNGEEINIPSFDLSKKKFDIAIEILGFQFFTKDREPQIKQMKECSNVSIFFEKFSTGSQQLWGDNEHLKNTLHKPKFFTSEQIEDKQTRVLDDMGDYLVDHIAFRQTLKRNYIYIYKIAQIGNFAGYVCSDFPIPWGFDHLLQFNKFTAKFK